MKNLNEFRIPLLYKHFLVEIGDEQYEIDNTGIILYPTDEIEERNMTYEVKKYTPNCLLIGQDGDIGFFIKKNEGEKIYSLDLGALGSLEMREEAEDIKKFINLMQKEYRFR